MEPFIQIRIHGSLLLPPDEYEAVTRVSTDFQRISHTSVTLQRVIFERVAKATRPRLDET